VNDLIDIEVLISKFLSGEATPDEAILLEDWKHKDVLNQLYYTDCERAFHAINGTEPDYSVIDTEDAWKKVKSQLSPAKPKGVVRKMTYYQIAASVALVVGISTTAYFILGKQAAGNSSYATLENSKAVELSDGTCVIIAPHSELTPDKGYGKNNRLLHLKGSAYFSVVHTDELPLIVDAGKVFIKDIGTQYNVVAQPHSDSLYVHVDEGEVSLYDETGVETRIKRAESAFYIKSQKKIFMNATDEVIRAQMHDTISLNFVNAKLTDVVNTLNKKYHTTITIEKKSIENCTITSKFYNEKIETVLSIIAETLGVTYEKNKEGFIIKGEKCNH
jgi:ferric-dicitrate binding protein FerR (iron transport regulator)